MEIFVTAYAICVLIPAAIMAAGVVIWSVML